MDPKELTSILTNGIAVVRKLECDCRAILPPVGREDPAMLREIRELESIAMRLALELDIEVVTAQGYPSPRRVGSDQFRSHRR